MPAISIKYATFIFGLCLLAYNEIYSDSYTFISILGLALLGIGLYLISRGIGDKPDIDTYAIQSYDEEE